MKYPDRMARRAVGSRPFHTAISTTFGIEFAAFEEVMLPQLMTSGATNLLVIADPRMASMSLSDGSQLPMHLGRAYELCSPPVTAGVFHPKILLQVGRRAGRLFVGSANITASGLAGNAETVIELECSEEPSAEREIVRMAWRYLDGLVGPNDGAARDAVSWASERAPWLVGPKPEPTHVLDDGSVIAFLSNADDVGIARRFIDFASGDTVERLVVASPYWDRHLGALRTLRRAFEPKSTSIFLDFDNHEFPIEADEASDLEFRSLPKTARGRFAHAKIIVASTKDHDHLLIGSANCTEAALGRGDAPGINAEACIYRRLPRNAALASLDLLACLEEEPLDANAVEPRKAAPPIPLEKIAAARAGAFELDGDLLTWRPLNGAKTSGTIRLLNHDGRRVIEIPHGPFDGTSRQSFKIDPDHSGQISFAVISADGFTSTPSHVTHRSQLRSARREVATGAIARAMREFDPGSDFEIWMHGAFDALASADLADRPIVRAASLRTNPGGYQADHVAQDLTYDDFMETRTSDVREGGERNSSLLGTHMDSIRIFLNALIGQGPIAGDDETGNDDWLDGGAEDENEDNEDNEDDECPGTSDITTSATYQIEGSEEGRSTVVDARTYSKAVDAYVSNLTGTTEPLGSSDVLRMRFWLMLLLHKAQHPGLPRGLAPNTTDTSWPRMALRVVAAFFSGCKPPVTRLMISRQYTEMPVDFLEGWATALWTLDAIREVVPATPRNKAFLIFVDRARSNILTILGLTPAELGSETVVKLRQALDRTVGQRIGSVKTSA